MDFTELFDLHEKLETRINAYWTYWSVAVIAIGGWLFSGKQSLSMSQSVGVLLGAIVFFFCNLGVLSQATKLVVGIRDEIRIKSAETEFVSPNLLRALSADDLKYRLRATVLLHLAVDCVVIWALLSHA